MLKSKSLVFLLWSSLLVSSAAFAQKKVYLSIDGGGMFGYIPASLIEDLESKLNGLPIYQSLDGIMGTSTGAIISALATSPANSNGTPYSGKEIVEFYKTKAPAIFGSAIEGVVKRMISMFTGTAVDTVETLRTELQSTLKIETHLSDSLIPLYIQSYDTNQKAHYTFNSEKAKTSGAHNTQAWAAVLASCSISMAFGPATVDFSDNSKRVFIDSGERDVCDPSNAMYELVLNSLSTEDEAIIFSLGTGFSPGCKVHTKAGSKVQVVRIEPNMSNIIPPTTDITGRNMIAANATPEQITKLEKAALSVMETSEYKQLVNALKIRAEEKLISKL